MLQVDLGSAVYTYNQFYLLECTVLIFLSACKQWQDSQAHLSLLFVFSPQMSQETPKKPPPPRPEPPTTLGGGGTPQEQFENAYQEAYLLIDRGITLITEGHNAQASTSHFLSTSCQIQSLIQINWDLTMMSP